MCEYLHKWVIEKNELSLSTNKITVKFLVFPISFSDVYFFPFCRLRSPNVWIITIGIFPRPSTTLSLHYINYQIGINLAARSGDRSTRVRSSLIPR